jgi:hypothetical protein
MLSVLAGGSFRGQYHQVALAQSSIANTIEKNFIEYRDLRERFSLDWGLPSDCVYSCAAEFCRA